MGGSRSSDDAAERPGCHPSFAPASVDLPRRIIISISSDIGLALADAWLDQGIQVAGTFRNDAAQVSALRERGARLVHCDLARRDSIDSAAEYLHQNAANWDVLVSASGLLDPVGPFLQCNFDEWQRSFDVNLTAPLRLTHQLMSDRHCGSQRGPIVLWFAGGGTNSAPTNTLAYTLAKVASVKMIELLDAEIPDTRFAILGPGWVKTKIHEAVLKASGHADAAAERTRAMLNSNAHVPMARVVDCCNWLIESNRESIGGRNISLVHDDWDDPKLLELLALDSNMYKLRRAGN